MKLKSKFLAATFALLLPTAAVFACTNIIVTKGATTDGSALVTYSADSHTLYGELYFNPASIYEKSAVRAIYDWDSGKFLGNIPQVGQTYQRMGNMNEHQLIITETTFGGRSELHDANGKIDYGSLIYVTLERAKTAREAIKTIGELVAANGYYSSGESFSIVDKDEAWIMEIIGKGGLEKGAVWVAVRIPDGYISAHANQARITTFPLNDPENCIYSSDVITFARKQNYFKGKDSEFSFCDTYAPLDFGALRGCEARVWSVFNQAGCDVDKYLDYAMGYNAGNKMPLYMKAPKKLSPKEVADFMRDHYDGTAMDMHTDIGAGGEETPYRWRPMSFEHDGKTYLNERAIATQQTGWWMMGQTRSWLPDEIGAVIWFGVDDAATSCLTPIYVSSTKVPECFKSGNGNMTQYSPTAAFWIFNRVAQFAYLRYKTLHPEIKKVYDSHENTALENSTAIDNKAKELLAKSKPEAIKFITDYSVATAQNMFNKWADLDNYLMVKYIDGNIKKENEGGFIDNGNGRNIPTSPEFPGYSNKWKEAVAKDTGDKLISK